MLVPLGSCSPVVWLGWAFPRLSPWLPGELISLRSLLLPVLQSLEWDGVLQALVTETSSAVQRLAGLGLQE